MTTIETITVEQIQQLRLEAGEHGDALMTRICDEALSGKAWAREECVNVIQGAEACGAKP